MWHFRYGLVLVVWPAFIHVDAQSRVGFTRSLGKPTLPFAKAKGTRLRGSEGQRAIDKGWPISPNLTPQRVLVT
jgi:hypothetical protein